MSDRAYSVFQHYGTAAERTAFTPVPPAGTQPIYTWRETDTGNVYIYDTSWHVVSGSLIGVQYITATGAFTYTPTAGTNSIVLEMVGAGGGGAGVAQAAANQANMGQAGGGGAYLLKRLTSNFSGATGSVGAKGAGGAAGNNSGANGGSTTFIDTAGSPTTYTAGGGTGGAPQTSAAPVLVLVGVAGGAATNGDINVPGGPSGNGHCGSIGNGCNSGVSGTSRFSGGVRGVRTDTGGSTGINADGKGGGGGGAASINNAGGNKAGGNGSDGIVIIWEYS